MNAFEGMKTINEIENETGIKRKTLLWRLKSKNWSMIEGADYIMVGKKPTTLLSEKGVEKIIKKYK